MIDTDIAAVDEFNLIWAGVTNVGLTNGGGVLGGDADTLFLFDSGMADAGTINSVDYSGFENVLVGDDTYATIQFAQSGSAFSSSLSNGVSAEFFNDNFGAPNDLIRLAGNPGAFKVVPEPSSILLLAIGSAAVFFVNRRR